MADELDMSDGKLTGFLSRRVPFTRASARNIPTL